jgi:hypothetical protein
LAIVWTFGDAAAAAATLGACERKSAKNSCQESLTDDGSSTKRSYISSTSHEFAPNPTP